MGFTIDACPFRGQAEADDPTQDPEIARNRSGKALAMSSPVGL
jgi:hypothetical protein